MCFVAFLHAILSGLGPFTQPFYKHTILSGLGEWEEQFGIFEEKFA